MICSTTIVLMESRHRYNKGRHQFVCHCNSHYYLLVQISTPICAHVLSISLGHFDTVAPAAPIVSELGMRLISHPWKCFLKSVDVSGTRDTMHHYIPKSRVVYLSTTDSLVTFLVTWRA